MDEGIETIIRIASEEFGKLMPEGKAAGLEVEEVEKASSGNFFVTIGYWAKDSKPDSDSWKPHSRAVTLGSTQAHKKARKETAELTLQSFLNPWRRKYKRVEVDPKAGTAIAIKMYEPPLGVT